MIFWKKGKEKRQNWNGETYLLTSSSLPYCFLISSSLYLSYILCLCLSSLLFLCLSYLCLRVFRAVLVLLVREVQVIRVEEERERLREGGGRGCWLGTLSSSTGEMWGRGIISGFWGSRSEEFVVWRSWMLVWGFEFSILFSISLTRRSGRLVQPGSSIWS